QPGLQRASLRLHLAASLINLLVAIVVLGLTIAASAGAFFIQRRARRAVGGRSSHAPEERRTVGLPGREDQGAPENPLVTKLRSPKARLALELAGLAVAAVFEGRRDPGARVVGIRRVDARTGEKMSRGQVVVR